MYRVFSMSSLKSTKILFGTLCTVLMVHRRFLDTSDGMILSLVINLCVHPHVLLVIL